MNTNGKIVFTIGIFIALFLVIKAIQYRAKNGATTGGTTFSESLPCPQKTITQGSQAYNFHGIMPSKSGSGFTVSYLSATPTPQTVASQLEYPISQATYDKWKTCS